MRPGRATPIDAFVLAKLEERGWQLVAAGRDAARADPPRVVRPDRPAAERPRRSPHSSPTPSPDAYERLVDRLLASPRYGERRAQHWLDVVRFAETDGYEYDRHVPDAWRYRDYVIDSLNGDKPFDQFVTRADRRRRARAGRSRVPDGQSIFHRLGPVRRNAGNPEIALSRNEVLTERTDILGTAFLGLTIGCARCHNHKLEPITQKDYYRLQAYLRRHRGAQHLAGRRRRAAGLGSRDRRRSRSRWTRLKKVSSGWRPAGAR